MCTSEKPTEALECGNVHETTFEVERDGTLLELRFEACFNDQCSSARLANDSAVVQISDGDGKLSALAHFVSKEHVRVISVSWSTNGLIAEKEGDRYAVRVKWCGFTGCVPRTDSDYTTLGESVEIVESYSRSYPNGEGCDPGCLHIDSARRMP